MSKYNPKNERIKREYYRYQTEAKQKSHSTLKGIRKAIDRFESYIKQKDFSTFQKEQAIGFKKHLSKQKAVSTGEPLSKSTVLSTVNLLKEFFQWLCWQPGYKSKIHVPDIEYFNLTEKEVRTAKAKKIKDFPSLEQVRSVIQGMPTTDLVQRRNRALVAFTICTGMRDSAIASLKIKHVDMAKSPILIRQEPDEIRTKFSKLITSHFLPVGDDIAQVFRDWFHELCKDLKFGPSDPVFPRTKLSHDENKSFKVGGVEPVCWNTTSPIRKVFKESFQLAGLPYFSPHRFRDTLVHFGQQICKTPEEFKAWSQSLGHDSPLTTFSSYGTIDPFRQGELIAKMKSNPAEKNEVMQGIEIIQELLKARHP